MGLLQIDGLALALDIGTEGAANIRAFIIVQSGHLQGAVDDLHRAVDIALLVGILYPQDELAFALFGQQIGIKGGTKAADMHVAGGAGGETGADGWHCCDMGFDVWDL